MTSRYEGALVAGSTKMFSLRTRGPRRGRRWADPNVSQLSV